MAPDVRSGPIFAALAAPTSDVCFVVYDRLSLERASARLAHGASASLVSCCWTGRGSAGRAAMLGAQGALDTAARCAPHSWGHLAAGDVEAVLRLARADTNDAARVLEGEALVCAGAVVAGIEVLRDAHRSGYAPATVALTRRLHEFGDAAGAIEVARCAEFHVGCATVRARAALSLGRAPEALRALIPFLSGHVVLPDAASAGVCAVLGASALAATARSVALRTFAQTWLDAPDLDPSMLPWAVRTAWMAGEAGRAWECTVRAPAALSGAARAELCVLAGDPSGARAALDGGGESAHCWRAVELLDGTMSRDPDLAHVFSQQGLSVHVWCGPDRRFAPWREAALCAAADVALFDLGAGALPDGGVAHVATDEASLIAALDPVRLCPGSSGVARRGVHIAPHLCRGIALGLDWPSGEDALLRRSLGFDAIPASDAAVVVGPPSSALDAHHRGARCVVLAPPGDPFWNGVLPERAFAGLRVVRADPRSAWAGAAGRVLQAVESLLPGIPQGPL